MTPSRARWVRVGVVGALLVALLIAGQVTGLYKHITFASMRHFIVGAHGWGVLLYIGYFVGLELAHFPGTVLFATAVAIWGRLLGGALGFATALLSISVTFAIVRAIGGTPVMPEKPAFLRQLMKRLETHPISTVALLRLVSFLTPAVTYALALSPVRFSQMILGSAIGLVPLMVTIALLFERWLR